MFYFDISGDDIPQDAIENYAHRVLSEFFFREPKRDIDINIEFVEQCSQNASGYCDGDHSEINIEIARGNIWDGEYLPYTMSDMMLTLAHELVHAKQYLKKELSPYGGLWKKQIIDCENIPHEELPWEKEAYSLEKTLFETHWRQV